MSINSSSIYGHLDNIQEYDDDLDDKTVSELTFGKQSDQGSVRQNNTVQEAPSTHSKSTGSSSETSYSEFGGVIPVEDNHDDKITHRLNILIIVSSAVLLISLTVIILASTVLRTESRGSQVDNFNTNTFGADDLAPSTSIPTVTATTKAPQPSPTQQNSPISMNAFTNTTNTPSHSPTASPTASPSIELPEDCEDSVEQHFFSGYQGLYCHQLNKQECSVPYWKAHCQKTCNTCGKDHSLNTNLLTNTPSNMPSPRSSSAPSIPPKETSAPTTSPTLTPSFLPTDATETPTSRPSNEPSEVTSISPTKELTLGPSASPSIEGSGIPSSSPTHMPSTPIPKTTFYVTGGEFKGTERLALESHLSSLPSSNGEWLFHLGDFNSVLRNQCEPRVYQKFYTMFSHSSVPVYLLPGDHEWNDCPDPDIAWSNWVTYLNKYDQHWDKPSEYAVKRADDDSGLFSFLHRRVLYVGVKVLGGFMHDRAEWDEQHQTSLQWIDEKVKNSFDDVDLIVIAGHAAPSDDNNDFFEPLILLVGHWNKMAVYFHHSTDQSDTVEYVGVDERFLIVSARGSTWPPLKVDVDIMNKDFNIAEDDWYTVPPSQSPVPSNEPSLYPSNQPSVFPTNIPTLEHSHQPSWYPSSEPTLLPTNIPTSEHSHQPTIFKSSSPTVLQTTVPSSSPEEASSSVPTDSGSNSPTFSPTPLPSKLPTKAPTLSPTLLPTRVPTRNPTEPISFPPTVAPTTSPTSSSTNAPTKLPTIFPTLSSTNAPTEGLTNHPTQSPIILPIDIATNSIADPEPPTQQKDPHVSMNDNVVNSDGGERPPV